VPGASAPHEPDPLLSSKLDSSGGAFEAAPSKLGLVDRKDSMTMAVAKLIIELAKNGERDPKKNCASTL
jgi:hypothetical protein